MADETKVQLMNDGKALWVSCDNARFTTILRGVCDSIGCTEPIAEVVDVHVTDSSQRQQPVVSYGLRDRLALVGCAVLSFVFLFVFLSGITKIIEMFSK